MIPEGLQIDLEEGWKKIISRQFGGNPGKGFGELVQNFLDSYNTAVPWSQRRGIITYGDYWVSLKDFGSGLNLNKIRLVTQMGGTDKSADPHKIGKFGIGFFSIFNPALGTRKVEITTRCEGQTIKLEYLVTKAGERPLLQSRVLNKSINYSTEVKVYFNRRTSAKQCVEYGKKSLRYYPCDIRINGKAYPSVWNEATKRNAFFFKKNHCDGFFKAGQRYRSVTILCKYEYITEMSPRYFITGGHRLQNNLDDFSSRETPLVPGTDMVLNCNQLSVTISRDSFYLDYNYKSMIADMNVSLLKYMGQQFDQLTDQVKLANLYILRKRIKSYWDKRTEGTAMLSPAESVFEKLLNSRLFTLNGKKELHSLLDLQEMKSEQLPLYFSEDHSNLRWLGGAFKHDFIVKAETCRAEKGAPGFYQKLFSCLFGDVVNLDTIGEDPARIQELLERDIIRKESLEPACSFIEPRALSPGESQLLDRLERLLNREEILETIERNINLPLRHIHPAFFTLGDGGMHISTGLFDADHNPINDDFISNFVRRKEDLGPDIRLERKNQVLLGLCLDHPFIKKLTESENPQKEYFALTYIAHELTACQEVLAPYSTFFQLVKSRLSSELQKQMLLELMPDQ